MTGANNEVVEKIAEDFNASQSDYKVDPGLQGHLPRDAERRHRRLPRRPGPRHPAGLRRRHRRDDGAREGAIKPVAEVLSEGGADLRQEPVPAGHRRLLFEARRHDAVLPLQLAPRRSSTTTRTSSRRPGSTSNDPPKTWNEVWDGREEDQGSRAPRPAATPRPGSPGSTSRTSPPGTTSPTAPTRTASPAPTSSCKINAPIFVNHFQAIADLAKDGTFKYGGRTSEAKQIFLAGECGIFTESLGRPRRHRQVRHELRHRPAALRQRRRRRAAEHHSRRRQPLGLRRQVRRDLQGRRRLLRLPVADRRAGSTCTRPPATCR